MQEVNQYYTDLLHSRNLRATAGRIELLSKMHDATRALSYSEIQETMHDVDRVTLYRTLDTLTNQGIIHQAYRENNEVHYALCGTNCNEGRHEHEHIHFKCDICEAVTCQELHGQIEIRLPDFQINKISLRASGICKTCMEN